MRRAIAFIALTGALAVAGPAAAENAVFEAVRTLCMAQHAEPEAVFRAAEQSGWSRMPDPAGASAPQAYSETWTLFNMYPAANRRHKEVGGRKFYLLAMEAVRDTSSGRLRFRDCWAGEKESAAGSLLEEVRQYFNADPTNVTDGVPSWWWVEEPAGRRLLPDIELSTRREALSTAGAIYMLAIDSEGTRPKISYGEVAPAEPQAAP